MQATIPPFNGSVTWGGERWRNSSVLVLPDPESGKGRVHAIAGRSLFLDGGLRSLVLDAASGALLSESVVNEVDPLTGCNVQQGHEWPPDLPAGLPDVLSFSDNTVYMGIQPHKR